MLKVAIVLGSSRGQGDSAQCVDYLCNLINVEVFDLSKFSISFYDYQHQNRDDDFSQLISQLLEFEHIVFATPMYWYSMSAQMKVFIDRLSDLLTIEKDLGRKLKGKSCSLLSTGYDLQAPDCLWQPFNLTAKYLHMDYLGMVYCPCPEGFYVDEHKSALVKFVENTLSIPMPKS